MNYGSSEGISLCVPNTLPHSVSGEISESIVDRRDQEEFAGDSEGIAERYGVEIEWLGSDEDHVHL